MQRRFRSWLRTGFAAALDGDPARGSERAAIPLTAGLEGEPSRAVPIALQLAGPGDVAGLDPREVVRTEPYDGCPHFESAYFPYVELASPDLPWRFTPQGPWRRNLDAAVDPDDPQPAVSSWVQQAVRPWLALVVVPVAGDDPVQRATSPGGLPRLRCDGSLLPDPAQAWAWAHVADGVSRLLCPIRLAARQRYRACLVPAFAAGLRAAGITLSEGGDPLAPAWSGAGEVILPVYYSWTFSTADGGAFEAVLAGLLRPSPVPAGAAGVRIQHRVAGLGRRRDNRAHGDARGPGAVGTARRPGTGTSAGRPDRGRDQRRFGSRAAAAAARLRPGLRRWVHLGRRRHGLLVRPVEHRSPVSTGRRDGGQGRHGQPGGPVRPGVEATGRRRGAGRTGGHAGQCHHRQARCCVAAGGRCSAGAAPPPPARVDPCRPPGHPALRAV